MSAEANRDPLDALVSPNLKISERKRRSLKV